MCALSYTVGPQMYHPTRLPSSGTKGTFVLVNELSSRGASRLGPSLDASSASGGDHQGTGAQQPQMGPYCGNVFSPEDMVVMR